MPGVPKSLLENLSHFFVILNTKPISVRSLVSSIKGKSPGMTAVINKLMPLIVPFEYFDGFERIKSIIEKIKIEKNNSPKIELFFKDFLKCFVFVGFI